MCYDWPFFLSEVNNIVYFLKICAAAQPLNYSLFTKPGSPPVKKKSNHFNDLKVA